MQDQVSSAAAGRQRKPRKATPKSLENAALAYLARFATSAANLRRVLMARVERSARIHGTDREEGAVAVDALIARFCCAALLDDAGYAAARAETLLRRGTSLRSVAARLAAKGVDGQTIAATLARVRADSADPDLAAAVAYARRRRIGPWRGGIRAAGRLTDGRSGEGWQERAARRERDLAALARQGFAPSLAVKVVDAPDADTLEAELAEGQWMEGQW